MAESTRTRDVAQRVERAGAVGHAFAVLLLAGAVVVSLRGDLGLVPVLVVAILGTAVGVGALLLPRRWNAPAMVVALVMGLFVLVRVDRALTFPWTAGLLLGLTLGLDVLWRRQQPSGPRPATGVLLRMVQDDGPDDVETTDPSVDDVRRAVTALDGRRRTGVSVFRGVSRLDVGGDAAGPVVVYRCADVSTPRPAWAALTTGAVGDDGAEVELRVVGLEAYLPAASVANLPAAMAALEELLLPGGRATDLAWDSDRTVDDLRAPFERWT